MPVVLCRVDDRLIHGQIVEGWIPFVQADKVYVVDDEISADEERCHLLQLIIPLEIDCRAIPVSHLKERLADEGSSNLLLLFASFRTLLDAVEAGASLTRVNVGNLHHSRGGFMISPSVFINREDLQLARKLHHLGVQLEILEVPKGRKYNLNRLIAEMDERK